MRVLVLVFIFLCFFTQQSFANQRVGFAFLHKGPVALNYNVICYNQGGPSANNDAVCTPTSNIRTSMSVFIVELSFTTTLANRINLNCASLPNNTFATPIDLKYGSGFTYRVTSGQGTVFSQTISSVNYLVGYRGSGTGTPKIVYINNSDVTVDISSCTIVP